MEYRFQFSNFGQILKPKDTFFTMNYTLNCGGKILDLSTPMVMGIVNITPDSFYDGGQSNMPSSWLALAEKHLQEGAGILDLGAFSSRPGAAPVSQNEELERLIPAVKSIISHFPNCIISVDTYRSEVARQAIDHGATIINDISGGEIDPLIVQECIKSDVPYIAMHMKGNPSNMQSMTDYEDITTEIFDYFAHKINNFQKQGLKDIIIDLGFGFSKTLSQNYLLLKQLKSFQQLGVPILTGISRKSMIYKALDCSPKEALNGTTALHMAALMNGTNILRVHDVKEAKETIELFKLYVNCG